MDVDDLIEQALLPSGGEHVSAVEASQVRRTLNLLLIELRNKNIPLSKLSYLDYPLTQDVSTYVLDPSIVDILQATVTTDSVLPRTDLLISRKSLKEYQEIPNKAITNRPNLFATQRLKDAVTVMFWPVPNLGTYIANFLIETKIEDITAAYQKIDISTRYLPLLTAWLAYKLSVIRQGVGEEVRNRLKADYMELYVDTVEEDRERVDFIVTPMIPSGRG
jgi:hypothetical protein